MTVDAMAYQDRLHALTDRMHTMELDGIALNPGPSFSYFTGLNLHLSERPVLFLYLAGRPPAFILPKLEQEKLAHIEFPHNVFCYGENPAQWGLTFREAGASLGLDRKRIGVEPGTLRLLEYTLLQDTATNTLLSDASQLISSFRAQKSPEELRLIRKAVQIAEQALQRTLPIIQYGATEKEIAQELIVQLYHCGSELELPFFPIVASGPNSANPHAVPGNRELRQGDPLLIDWGATYKGYVSDLTRTFSLGPPSKTLVQLHAAVLAANQAGCAAGSVGSPCSGIDRAARSSLQTAGLAESFIHRTGHGLGLACHEPPYLHHNNQLLLEEGMVYTVEPGAYFPEKMGIRIEDMVYLGPQGPVTLTTLSRELIIL